MSDASSEVAEFYARGLERDRLAEGAGVLELVRTQALLQRYLPSPPAVVADVGGGPGRYAIWLADLGYRVHLVDPVPLHIEQARDAAGRLGVALAGAEVGDARTLRLADASVDAVLLLGPLYHLTQAEDRARSLEEAARVLKPGGRLFAAAISRFASALDGLARELLQDSRFARIVEQDLRDGQHRNPTERSDYFTTAYFHRPEELAAEVLAAGLALDGVYGVEGPGWILPDVAERMADPDRRSTLLAVARMLETERSIVGSSAHLLAVAQRPTSTSLAGDSRRLTAER